ncbi:STAS domain-containing protein [Microbispora bryophytorum]|uniref:Anti-sigma factor antagonist n=1 Tax=Microbispora bryophytorum subsp. camponoti TaxID=1677852 RepID=A0ABR8L689_9ACTN|nr:STAS domain-containing protein [Microbispora camponoti]MBD3146436.1 STAS domain-containing protein [Microbispora camponoti]
MHDFEVSVAQSPPFTLVTLSGELDVITVPELRERVAPLLARPATRILFDVEKLRFIDSAGMRVLIDACVRTPPKDGDGALCGMSPQMRHLFSLLGLMSRFTVYPTRADAFSHPVAVPSDAAHTDTAV